MESKNNDHNHHMQSAEEEADANMIHSQHSEEHSHLGHDMNQESKLDLKDFNHARHQQGHAHEKNHARHEGHVDHSGHEEMSRKRFWVSTLL